MIEDILKAMNGTFWLAQDSAILPAVSRLSRHGTCPTARELVSLRVERLAEARNLAVHAASPVGREDYPEELVAGPGKKAIRASKGKIGVIPIYGMIQQRLTGEMMKLGGTSTEEVGAALDAMLLKDDIETIVLDIDSPGGTSYGVQELADKIMDARGKKRIYAIANSLMASAAYWIGTAAETVVVTPSGDVGSVGVYTVHVDESEQLKMDGIKVTLATAGKYKAEFASVMPLGQEAAERLGVMVQQCYDCFVGSLSRQRGVSKETVRKTYGEGRVLSANEALDAGMVDRIMSFDALVGRLLGRGGSNGGQAAESTELRRLRFDHLRRKAMAQATANLR